MSLEYDDYWIWQQKEVHQEEIFETFVGVGGIDNAKSKRRKEVNYKVYIK